ncbi:MAG: flippase-like domain-containing protein [Candidatus Aenigmatarchaeota archaeon]|nr:MAG: flippase-like domain-containing protein [Candidatus Aenigmarchaeota archaeon]
MALSIVLLAALIYFADVDTMARVLSSANLVYVAAGFGVWIPMTALRIYRWKYLLEKVDIRLPFHKISTVFLAGFYLSNITPAKSGDPIRSVLLRRACGVSFAKSLPSVLVERLIDVTVMVLLALVGLLFIPQGAYTNYLYSTVGLFMAASLVVVFIVSSRKRTYAVAKTFHGLFSFFPKIKSLEGVIKSRSNALSDSFVTYGHVPWLISAAIMTACIWFLEGVVGKIAFLSIGVNVPIMAVVAVIVISTLIGVLTLLPGGIGPTEISSVAMFVVIGAASLQDAAAAVLLMRLMSYWMYVTAGSVVLATKIK